MARAEQLAAGRWPNPRVTFNRESVAGSTENMFLVTQPLPITGRRGLDVDAAVARVAASRNRAEDRTRRLRADLRLAFAGVWLAQTRQRELARVRDQVQDLAAVLARREAAGDAAGFDRLRAEREALDLEAERALAASDLTRAQSALVRLFALPVDPAAVGAVRPGVSRAAVPPLDVLMARAEASRGELLALEHDLEAAGLASRSAARRRVPEPELVAGSKSSSTLGGDTGTVIALQATLSIFDRARPEQALAAAQAAEADAHAQAFRLALRADLIALRSAVLERRSALDRYRTAAAASDEIERIARVSYDAGELGILELLDAYRTAAEARIREAVLDTATWEAQIELEYVSGWELPS
jgi:cobalt-zinc-cadmium efflux system outer membrane protein